MYGFRAESSSPIPVFKSSITYTFAPRRTHTQRIAYQRFVIGRGSRVRSGFDIARTITECKERGVKIFSRESFNRGNRVSQIPREVLDAMERSVSSVSQRPVGQRCTQRCAATWVI